VQRRHRVCPQHYQWLIIAAIGAAGVIIAALKL